MNYISVCSGIEAATVAWHDLGFNPVGFSEIEPFPCAVLAHHYPHVPNYGDMTKFQEWNINDTVELIVGGTPCQSFSISGLRKGLDDPRGNLTLTFLSMVERFQPRWFLWENVTGVFSSGEGNDFARFMLAANAVGYSCSWRVFDAKYFNLPQQRERVFVVGHHRDWRCSSTVLLESESKGLFFNALQGKRSKYRYILDRSNGKKFPYPAKTLTTKRRLNNDENYIIDADGAIRYLTILECERLQGFPDHYTLIDHKTCSDTSRYKAIGNSMAVPVMRWIGERIKMVDSLER